MHSPTVAAVALFQQVGCIPHPPSPSPACTATGCFGLLFAMPIIRNLRTMRLIIDGIISRPPLAPSLFLLLLLDMNSVGFGIFSFLSVSNTEHDDG